MPTTTDPATTIAAAIRARRQALNLTQTELADRLGISQGRVREIESGGYRPTKPTVCRLAVALDCAPGDLDPDLGPLAVPPEALALYPDPDRAGAYLPHRPADASDLIEFGFPGAVGHQSLSRLAVALRASGRGLYLVP